MKKFIIVLLLTLSINSCKKDKQSNSIIIGKWKLIERYDDPGGGNGNWKIVPDSLSYILEFKKDYTFSKINNTVTIGGIYDINPISSYYQQLVLKYNNNSLDSLNFYFEQENLILNGSPYSCDESCAKKFKKINN